MHHPELPDGLPPLSELGYDLLNTTPWQCFFSLLRPFLCVSFYVYFAIMGWWPLAVLSVLLLFVTIVASAHDLAHQSLALPRWFNDIMLALIGMLVLESGHAYRITHMQHHRTFPDHTDDPEGDPAHMTLWRVILEGPIFLFRLWRWAWARAPRERGWLLLEAGWFFAFVLGSLLLLPQTPIPFVFALLTIGGSWIYPLTTVYLPHNVQGENALLQTYTLRGNIIPRLFLELTYHLEHHLYPAVPSHNYAELARRLEPHLRQAGVEPIWVW
ncbi:MAG: fatty acid desaturase [Ardenticatenales bacterium]|nr:fatty acid desaturase [Ardenticatenales bacterium]